MAAVYPLVRRWARVHVGDPAEADDLTQDVLVQVVRKIGSYSGAARFSTWLYTVTRNAAMDRMRRQGRRARLLQRPDADAEVRPGSPAPPDARLDDSWRRRILDGCFRRLPERQRQVFDLADLQGYSSPEIARMLGIRAVSVRAHLFKARRALRAFILEHHPDLVDDVS